MILLLIIKCKIFQIYNQLVLIFIKADTKSAKIRKTTMFYKSLSTCLSYNIHIHNKLLY